MCSILADRKGDKWVVKEHVIAAVYSWRHGGGSKELADLRRQQASDFPNLKAVQQASMALLKQALSRHFNKDIGQPFKAWDRAREEDTELPVVPEFWPREDVWDSQVVYNLKRQKMNSIYDSLRSHRIAELENAQGGGGSMPLKPHPKVPGPVRLVTAAISQVPRHATASQTAASTAAAAAGPGPASTRVPAADGALGPVNAEAALEQGEKQRRRVVIGLSEDEDEEEATLPVGAEIRAVVTEEQEATSPAAAAARAGNLQPLSRRSRRRITRKPARHAETSDYEHGSPSAEDQEQGANGVATGGRGKTVNRVQSSIGQKKRKHQDGSGAGGDTSRRLSQDENRAPDGDQGIPGPAVRGRPVRKAAQDHQFIKVGAVAP